MPNETYASVVRKAEKKERKQKSAGEEREELAQNLHPSPAICGMPTEKARHLITEIENHDRAFYTGYFGPISNERTDLYVNLRCMQWHKDYLEIYVGGGITAESDPEKEWQETCDKMQTMLQLLQE